MGPQEEYIETVVTCEGDFYDPEFHTNLQDFSNRLQDLINTGHHELKIKKVEPWNSVRVTFNIPKEAAVRLKQLAEQGDSTLRELGVLAVQVEGDRLISLTLAGKNNETTELVLRTSGSPVPAGSFELPDEMNLPGPSHVESTRRNIVQYLRDQGASGNLLDLNAILETLRPPDPGRSAAQDALHSRANPLFPPHFPLDSGHFPGHQPGLPDLPFLPGHPGFLAGFPSPSVRPHAFSSPNTSQSNPSPLSPNYPTPPPSVSNPTSPGRTLHNLPASLFGPNTSAALSNLPRLLGNRDITSSSPLLVNLLQNDIGGFGHLNNLMAHKFPGLSFSPMDISTGPPQPPVKKKRKTKKKKVPTATLR